MRILITGASGLIGRHLVANLAPRHQLVAISRHPLQTQRLLGTRVERVLRLQELDTLDDVDAIINLAGEPIADGRWTQARKERICSSRWETTEALLERLRHSREQPRIWLNASAVGFYGRQGPHPIDESFQYVYPEFTHQVCRRWEELALEAGNYGARVCILRQGIVLSLDGGALKKLLPAYRLGLGGMLGNGEQMMSWIHMDDLVAIYNFLLLDENSRGIYNATAPHAVSNREFSQCLADVLRRPHVLTTPAWALQLALGELADLLLYGQNVIPKRLQDAGFWFSYPRLPQALAQLLDLATPAPPATLG